MDAARGRPPLLDSASLADSRSLASISGLFWIRVFIPLRLYLSSCPVCIFLRSVSMFTGSYKDQIDDNKLSYCQTIMHYHLCHHSGQRHLENTHTQRCRHRHRNRHEHRPGPRCWATRMAPATLSAAESPTARPSLCWSVCSVGNMSWSVI